ncbi:hypothetical protein GT037_004313 [Alternaria burnsii]|uniref:Oxidoreductase acuF-like C2H2 type zinc-finger domain-containing protein n=1 Tax=Alternaria burnsii TaxID=1187904 RepID=A0A8H7EIX8_9PLEO|nr:uncharacterized protein GT037_004313 [Alternaria burnsii]KAF7677454.1 hypothetical protein GT037_004313 [Alternaria burnsii]
MRDSVEQRYALLIFRKEHGAAFYHSNEDSEPSSANTDESDESDSPWEVSSDSEVEQRPEQKLRRQDADRKSGRPPYSAKPGLLDSTNFIVECLWRLPIRRPAPADRTKDKNVADTTGYLPFDLMYVRDKFPGLNETVAARLAKMISRRRQLIRYRKDHTDALQEEKAAVVDVSKSEHNNLPSPLEADVASEPTPSLKAPSQRTELTKATTLKMNAPVATLWPTSGLYAQSVSESGSSIASEQTANAITIRFPNRPRTKGGRVLEQYICPYCSTAQITTSERRWKKHVLSDLQPYICTYPDCQLNDYFFEKKDDWYNHESRTHRVEWFCNTASHQSFVDMQEFLDHMHTVHSEPLDGAQLRSLHRGFQRPSNAHSGTCTLCGQHASILKSHLARHLEQLALFAIPQTDYMADLEQDDTSSNAARQGIPELSSPGSSIIACEVSSCQSDPEADNLEIDHGEFHTGGIRNVQLPEDNEKTIADESVDPEDEIDTSWDEITPKFKEARAAMHNDQKAEVSERRQTPDVYSASPESSNARRVGPMITSLNLPELLAQSRSRERSQISEQDQDLAEPSAKKENLDINYQQYQARDMANDSTAPSLRQRAGSVTSRLLSPFRSRSKVQSAEYPPMPGEQPRRIIVERVPSGSNTPRPSDSYIPRPSGSFFSRTRKDPLLDQPTESITSKTFSPSRSTSSLVGTGELLEERRKTRVENLSTTTADTDEPEVLFVAASLFEFKIGHERREGGIPYLWYVPGEVFDVIGIKGELWLARNQDDETKTVGWIWEKHFERLDPGDR